MCIITAPKMVVMWFNLQKKYHVILTAVTDNLYNIMARCRQMVFVGNKAGKAL